MSSDDREEVIPLEKLTGGVVTLRRGKKGREGGKEEEGEGGKRREREIEKEGGEGG